MGSCTAAYVAWRLCFLLFYIYCLKTFRALSRFTVLFATAKCFHFHFEKLFLSGSPGGSPRIGCSRRSAQANTAVGVGCLWGGGGANRRSRRDIIRISSPSDPVANLCICLKQTTLPGSHIILFEFKHIRVCSALEQKDLRCYACIERDAPTLSCSHML